MAYPISDSTNNANLGVKAPNKEVAYAGLLIVPDTFEIATKVLAETLATYNTALKAAEPNRMKTTGVCFDFVPEDSDDTVVESRYKGNKIIINGKNGGTFIFNHLSINAHKEWYKLNDRTDWAAYPFDANGNIYGVCDDGVKFKPRKLLSLQVLSRATTGTEEDARTRVKYVFADTDRFNRYGVLVNPTTWDVADLQSVHNVNLAIVGTWLATGGKVSVKFAETDQPITNLAKEDFAIPGKTITSATYSASDQTYTIVGTGYVTSEIDLVACASISLTTIAIESTGAADFIIA